MQIGELSRATGCPVQTIRYYEHCGLLPAPARSGGNYRHYDPTAVERLAFILRCRSLDMSLDEVRALLRVVEAPEGNCRAADATIEAHLAHVEHRLQELDALRKQLLAIRAACAAPGAPERCGVLNRLKEPGTTTGVASVHVPGAHGNPSHEAVPHRDRTPARGKAAKEIRGK